MMTTPLTTRPPTKFTRLLDREPTLHVYGFGLWDADARQPPDMRQSLLQQKRQALLNHADDVEATCAWIHAHLKPIKTLNRRHTSYGLKHCAATDLGYLPNGVFIAAMLLCGYRHEHGDGPNATFNVSERSITRAHAPHVAQGKHCV